MGRVVGREGFLTLSLSNLERNTLECKQIENISSWDRRSEEGQLPFVFDKARGKRSPTPQSYVIVEGRCHDRIQP